MFYNKKVYINSEYCDTTVRLGNYQYFYLLQNAMTDGFEVVDCGNRGLGNKCNGYWAVTKTKINVLRKPLWSETVSVKSNCVTDGKLRLYINTEIISENNEVIANGCQELCILDKDTHRPKRLSDTCIPYTAGETLNVLQFEKFPKGEEITKTFSHIVRSQNIDMSLHVNNIEYIRIAMDLFSVDELKKMQVSSMEVHYIGECREGDELSCERYDMENKSIINIKNSGKVAFEMLINY